MAQERWGGGYHVLGLSILISKSGGGGPGPLFLRPCCMCSAQFFPSRKSAQVHIVSLASGVFRNWLERAYDQNVFVVFGLVKYFKIYHVESKKFSVKRGHGPMPPSKYASESLSQSQWPLIAYLLPWPFRPGPGFSNVENPLKSRIFYSGGAMVYGAGAKSNFCTPTPRTLGVTRGCARVYRARGQSPQIFARP